MHILLWALEATPSPSDTGTVDENLVTPGPWGFAVMAALGVVVILLLIDMLRRIRRAGYRAEIREELDAEEGAAREGNDAVRASDTDDEDIDPASDRR